ncbi:hypothetical protein CPB83DRAFT_837126 [Crepidotus variabilis]|uniref:Uncharacterized protein n=1 Tax=Crepidotus variabilis TaxID=179855 RepID=A0A9P6ED92_9AGAR|nr:hypothetical protein CPB83DRAFT_837126 [Crepidotus variabilis]
MHLWKVEWEMERDGCGTGTRGISLDHVCSFRFEIPEKIYFGKIFLRTDGIKTVFPDGLATVAKLNSLASKISAKEKYMGSSGSKEETAKWKESRPSVGTWRNEKDALLRHIWTVFDPFAQGCSLPADWREVWVNLTLELQTADGRRQMDLWMVFISKGFEHVLHHMFPNFKVLQTRCALQNLKNPADIARESTIREFIFPHGHGKCKNTEVLEEWRIVVQGELRSPFGKQIANIGIMSIEQEASRQSCGILVSFISLPQVKGYLEEEIFCFRKPCGIFQHEESLFSPNVVAQAQGKHLVLWQCKFAHRHKGSGHWCAGEWFSTTLEALERRRDW